MKKSKILFSTIQLQKKSAPKSFNNCPLMCRRVLATILLLTILMINPSSSTQCFTAQFPLVLGGGLEGTRFRSIDIDSSSNIVVGGDSKDTVLCNTGSPAVPIVAYYINEGLLMWARQISGGSYEHVEAVIFNTAGTQIAVLLDKFYSGPLNILILQASNAAKLNNFEEAAPTSAALFSPKSMVFDSNNQLFLALSYNSRFTVIGMTTTITSAFTSTFTYLSAAIVQGCGQAFSIFEDSTNIIVGGTFSKNNGFLTYVCNSGILSLTKASGALNWQVATDSYIEFNDVMKLDIGWNNYIYGCGGIGTPTQKEFYVRFYQSATNAPSVTDPSYKKQQVLFQQRQYSTCADPYKCIAVGTNDPTNGDIMYHITQHISQQIGLIYIIKIDYSNNLFKMYNFNGEYYRLSNLILQARFCPATSHVYLIGSIMEYKSIAPGFPNYVGFVDKQNFLASTDITHCYISWNTKYGTGSPYTDPPSAFIPSTANPDFVQLASPLTYITSNLALIETTIGPTTNVYYSCHNSQALVTPQAPTLANQQYDKGTNVGTLSLAVPAWTIAETSCTATFGYHYLITPAEPTIILMSNTPSTVVWSSATPLGTYTVSITGSLGNGQSVLRSFTITIVNSCTSAVLSPPTLIDQEYLITSTAVSYTPAVFTSSVAACYITYDLKMADGTNILPNVMTYNAATRELVVQSINNNQVGIYNLKMTAVVAGVAPAVATFKVTVIHQCTQSTITSFPVTPVTFDISVQTVHTFTVPTWSQLYASPNPCPNIVRYLRMQNLATPLDPVLFDLTGNTVTITASLPKVGSYVVEVVGKVEDTGPIVYIQKAEAFTVTITNHCASIAITSAPITQQQYTLGDPTASFTATAWTLSYTDCGSLTYTAENVIDPLTLQPLDTTLVTFNPATLLFSVSSANLAHHSLSPYKIRLVGTMSFGVSTSVEFDLILIDPCQGAVLTAASLPTQATYNVGDPEILVNTGVSVSSKTSPICGSVSETFSVYDRNGVLVASPSGFVTWDPVTKDLKVAGSDPLSADLSNYTLKITTVQGVYAQVTRTISLKITAICLVRTLSHETLQDPLDPTFPLQYYMIGQSTPLQVKVQRYLKDNLLCPQLIRYSLRQVSGANAPAFISLDESQGAYLLLVAQKSARSDAYQKMIVLWVNGTVENPDGTQVQTGVKIPIMIDYPNLGPPSFKTELPELTLPIGMSTTFSFPPILDPDLEDRWKLSSIDLGEASSFINASFPLLAMRADVDTVPKIYQIKVTLIDDNPTPKTEVYVLLVTVEPQNNTVRINETVEEVLPPGVKKGSFQWQIRQRPKRKNTKEFRALIKLVDQDGLLHISFTRAIFITPNISEYNNETMKISVESPYPDDQEKYTQRNITRWQTKEVSAYSIFIQVEFEDPIAISPSFVSLMLMISHHLGL